MELLPHDEQEMLLGRKVEGLLTAEDRAAFAGRICLITGAGGSVGSELAHQIAACDPAKLVLVEQSELALFHIEQAIRELAPSTPLEPVLCDVTRAHRLRESCGALALMWCFMPPPTSM